jgi:hypothetical protein
MIQITAIRLAGGERHEHITDVRWSSAFTSAGQSTCRGIVDWLSTNSANRAVVAGGAKYVDVAVVQPPGGSAYIRTKADGEWTDNLLALPRF